MDTDTVDHVITYGTSPSCSCGAPIATLWVLDDPFQPEAGKVPFFYCSTQPTPGRTMPHSLFREVREAVYALNRARGRCQDDPDMPGAEDILAKLTQARDIAANLLGMDW